MNNFPYGIVSFSLADIEGSTKLYNLSSIVGVIICMPSRDIDFQ